MPFAPVNRAKFRKDHKTANDNAALDRLLATEFQSGRESISLGSVGARGDGAGGGGGGGTGAGILQSAKGLGPVVLPTTSTMMTGGGRKSFDTSTGGTGPTLLGRQTSGGRRISHDRDRGQMGLARNLSEKLGVRQGTSDIPGHASEGPFRATKRRLGSARRNPPGPSTGNGSGDEQEELSSRALGVYIDQEGRLHDKEYDPFEKVRSLSRRKVEKRRVFGAAREDESEVGSEGSGSMVSGFAGFDNRLGAGSRNNNRRDPRQSYDQDAHGRQGQGEREDEEWGSPNPDESLGTRTRSNTLWSEYDSGISATSPRPVHVDHSEFGDPTSPMYAKSGGKRDDLDQGPLSPTSSQPSSSQYVAQRNTSRSQPGSVKTAHTLGLARLEERPRSLLFPATPAQLAAQKIKERNDPRRVGAGKVSQQHHHQQHHHHQHHHHRMNDVVIEEETLRPPVAPFNPMFSNDKRGKSPASSIKSGKGKQRDSAESSRMYGYEQHQSPHGRRASTQSQPHQHHADGYGANKSISGVQHASSSVFSAGDMGYLPSRWARGEREFREGEEELDKYRPMEFRGTREDQKEPEWA